MTHKDFKLKKPILYSFALHLVIFLFVVLLSAVPILERKSEVSDEDKYVYIDFDLDDNLQNRIVRTDVGQESKDAAKDAFLGEKTIQVQEQMVKRADSSFESQPEASEPMESEDQAQAKVEGQEELTRGALSRFGVPIFSPGDQLRRVEEKDAPRWVDHSKNSFHRVSGGEYVEGLKEGEITALNTKEYVFYSYYQRIRQQLDLSWKPILREALIKRVHTGRHLASDMSHITKTVVILNQAGEVIRVRVLEESGSHDLDGAAVEAFNKAGPFPNPPRGLINPNGEIEVRWDFVLRT